MSKKISISIPNKVRPNLVKLFREYISNKKYTEYYNPYSMGDDYSDMADYWDEVFPGWDDDIDVVYPPSNGKNSNVIVMKPRKGKKKKHNKSKKGKMRIVGINEDDEYSFDDVSLDDCMSENASSFKEIWFYIDYHDKDDKLEFNSLKDFNDYCEEMGYYVGKEVADKIAWCYESHCCLNPESERLGFLEIMSEHSYGEMFYEACEEVELSEQ